MVSFEVLLTYYNLLKELEWNKEILQYQTKEFCNINNITLKDLTIAIRLLLTNSSKGFSFYDILNILGKQKTLDRLFLQIQSIGNCND